MKSSGLLARLEAYERDASPAERNIIRFVLGHQSQASEMSIRDLAAATFTSSSTVTRFCHKMECSGFKGFQRGIVHGAALQQESQTIALDGVGANEPLHQIIKTVTMKNIRSLEATKHLLSPEVVAECARLIHLSRSVNLFGIGASLLVARDLQLKLLRANEDCNLADDTHGQILYAKNMTPEDLAIVISYSGLTQEMLQCTSIAHQCKSKIIAVTRNSVSTPLTRLADYILPVAATELIVRSGAMSSRISQMNVIDILYAAYVSQNYSRCMKLFSKNYIKKESDSCSI